MSPQEKQSNPRNLGDIGYQFLLGAAIGLILAWIPLAITMPTLTLWNILAVATLVLACGSFSALLGKRFLKALLHFLESFPPIA